MSQLSELSLVGSDKMSNVVKEKLDFATKVLAFIISFCIITTVLILGVAVAITLRHFGMDDLVRVAMFATCCGGLAVGFTLDKKVRLWLYRRKKSNHIETQNQYD
jgi:hypothetical protein